MGILKAHRPMSIGMELDRDNAITLLAFMMAGADGDVDAEEEVAIGKALADRHVVLRPGATRLIRDEALRTWDGSQAAWRSIRDALGDDAAREDAFTLAVEVVMADHALEPNEVAEIQEMADQLDISRSRVSAMLAQHA